MEHLAASHWEKITHLMQEFDKHEIGAFVQLDNYEQTRRGETEELEAPTSSQQPPQPHNTDEKGADGDTNNEQWS